MADGSQDRLKHLQALVAKAPTQSGVYRWLGPDEEVLYVGKAKNLRARLKQYVQSGAMKDQGPWKRALMERAVDVDVTVTNSDLEAIVLETNLIKQLKPKYNVMMKDDKHYVYARITVQDTFPRIELVRKMIKDGSVYIGPKTNGYELKQTLNFLRTIFPYRTCKMEIEVEGASSKKDAIPLDVICKNKDRKTPCLDHHIGQCGAPCIGLVDPADYRERIIMPVVRFLKGDQDEVRAVIQGKMQEHASAKKFELAAKLRDQLRMLDNLKEQQLASDAAQEDGDVIGVALLSGRAVVVLMQVRNGKLIGEHVFFLQGEGASVANVLAQFLPQYYSVTSDIPARVLIGEDIEEHALMEDLLSDYREKRVHLLTPQRGRSSKLLKLAEQNAQQKALQQEAKWEAEARNTQQALEELTAVLELPALPKRIEGYDISHLGGTETVGSMVVCTNGKPDRKQYRSFTIRSVSRGDVDDYASLKEVLTRRLKHVLGGLKYEVAQWETKGVTMRKARKADLSFIQETLAQHDDIFVQDATDTKQCLVAEKDEKIVAFVRLRQATKDLQEVASLWVDESVRGHKLGHTLMRLFLKNKKGKLYACTRGEMVPYYEEFGFRHVLRVPPHYEERLAKKDGSTVLMLELSQLKEDASLKTVPDLLVIDGGKGQVSTVAKVLKDLDLSIPMIGLAKREEEVFKPGESLPRYFQKDSPAKFLLMRLRDEAHRFANRHREKRLFTHMTTSELDSIPGIGPSAQKKLLDRFGSVQGIQKASDEELSGVLNAKQAEAVRKWRVEN